VVAVMAGGWSAFGCQRGASTRPGGGSTTSGGGDSPVVARIDDVVITAADVQDRINKQSPFVRARYSDLEKRKEFLDNLIRFEVMAKEADKRGYAHDPEVERVMKQQMISKFLQKDFESKLRVEDVPDADVAKYYKEHAEEFNRPDEVRVSQIVVKDKARAEKLAGEARTASHADGKAFRELVIKFSEDEDSKARGGDLTSFDRSSTLYPKELVEAAFALKEVGDVSPPVKTDKGYHVLRLTQKHPGFSRPLGEVKRQIQQRLFRDVRAKALDAFVADLKTKYAVTIDEANLAKVTIDSGAGQPPGGMARPSSLPGALGVRRGPGGPLPGMPAPPSGPSSSPVSPAPAAPKAP
jgi:peptidyl-prolyl cis-trans isomerase C